MTAGSAPGSEETLRNGRVVVLRPLRGDDAAGSRRCGGAWMPGPGAGSPIWLICRPTAPEFLLRTSVAEVLDGELCDALTGRYDGATVLRSLEADLPFLTATSADRSRYRYHPLLAEMLRAELAGRRPGAAPGLHRVAAGVLQARGNTVDVVGHLLAAGDTDQAFSLYFPARYASTPVTVRPCSVPPCAADSATGSAAGAAVAVSARYA